MVHLYRLHSSWDACRQPCDDDSSSFSPACSCGFQTRTHLQLKVVGPETHLFGIRAAEAAVSDASGLPKRNQVGETHLCYRQASLRQTGAPLHHRCHHPLRPFCSLPASRCLPSSSSRESAVLALPLLRGLGSAVVLILLVVVVAVFLLLLLRESALLVIPLLLGLGSAVVLVLCG